MKQLSNGVSLVTFAEGTRSKDGRLQTFKKGAFRISKAVRSHILIRLQLETNEYKRGSAHTRLGYFG